MYYTTIHLALIILYVQYVCGLDKIRTTFSLETIRLIIIYNMQSLNSNFLGHSHFGLDQPKSQGTKAKHQGTIRHFLFHTTMNWQKIVFQLLFRRENGPGALLISITTTRYLYEMSCTKLVYDTQRQIFVNRSLVLFPRSVRGIIILQYVKCFCHLLRLIGYRHFSQR